MSKELMIFNSDEFREIDGLNYENYYGCFYAIEIGEYIKIGCTTKPKQRIGQLKTLAKYMNKPVGRVAISKKHTNYRDNEKILLNYFSNNRIDDTELCNISMDNFVDAVCSNGLHYSDEIKNCNSEELTILFKNIFGYNNSEYATTNNDSDIIRFCNEYTNDAVMELLFAFENLSNVKSDLIKELDIIIKEKDAKIYQLNKINTLSNK